jgi:hypothetical protein
LRGKLWNAHAKSNAEARDTSVRRPPSSIAAAWLLGDRRRLAAPAAPERTFQALIGLDNSLAKDRTTNPIDFGSLLQ